MQDAAIVLATSQDKWAEYLRCSLYDWHWANGQWIGSPNLKIAVEKELYGSFEELQSGAAPSSLAVHYIIVRPSRRVDEGWIELDIPRGG